MNALHYDEWKDTDAVENADALPRRRDGGVHSEGRGTQFMERAVRFAKRHRAVGIGVLGWHSYLQSNMIVRQHGGNAGERTDIPDDQRESYEASEELADEFGEPEMLEGYGRRNTTTMSVAPTKSKAVSFWAKSVRASSH